MGGSRDPMMALLKRYLNPLSPYQLKNNRNVIKFWPPLKKLSRSAHASACVSSGAIGLFWSESTFPSLLFACEQRRICGSFDVCTEKHLAQCVDWSVLNFDIRKEPWFCSNEVSVCLFVLNIPPAAKVIWGRGQGLKSHTKNLRCRGSNLQPLIYKASGSTP